MLRNRVFALSLLAFCALCLPACGQVEMKPASPDSHADMEHQHGHHMMNLANEATDKCEPKFTYQEGPQGPSHWPGECNTGKLQSPIDIGQTTKVPMMATQFGYQAVDLDVINDCNQHRFVVRLPDNDWLKDGRKPYFLTEIAFHEPGENAVNGKRPRMSVQLVHFSPEGVFLIIEVPVVAGKENRAFKAILSHLPAPGKEDKVAGVKINPADLLPADRTLYRFQGSLTMPICNQGATWLVMKNPIEFSEAQIAEYEKHYHNTARSLQPLNGRLVTESE